VRGAGCGGVPPPLVLLRAGMVGMVGLFAVVHPGWVLLLTLLLPCMLLLPRILPSLLLMLPRHGREGGMMRKVHVLLVLAVLMRLLLLMKLRLLAVVVATSITGCRHTACPDRGTYVWAFAQRYTSVHLCT